MASHGPRDGISWHLMASHGISWPRDGISTGWLFMGHEGGQWCQLPCMHWRWQSRFRPGQVLMCGHGGLQVQLYGVQGFGQALVG